MYHVYYLFLYTHHTLKQTLNGKNILFYSSSDFPVLFKNRDYFYKAVKGHTYFIYAPQSENNEMVYNDISESTIPKNKRLFKEN